jgi:translation initiation factor IF-3
VRLIDHTGENRGVVPVGRAMQIATDANLDLVEVAAKQARKHQSQIVIKEIKFRPKIDPHDYATKKGHVERFLRNKDKVKVTIMFRGRELLHPERGESILLRLAEDLKDFGTVESKPNLDGRNMVMMLNPLKDGPAPSARPGGDAPAAAEPTTAPAPAGAAAPATRETE